MKRITLPDLIDPTNLIAWLAYDGKPPTVEVFIPASRQYGMGYKGTRETHAVVDADTVSIWWNALSGSFCRSSSRSLRLNQHKPQTEKQWLAECLKAIGIKGFGTIAERVQRIAIAFRPDLYKDAKSVRAEDEAEAAHRSANDPAMTADRAVTVKVAEELRANPHADLMQATNDARDSAV